MLRQLALLLPALLLATGPAAQEYHFQAELAESRWRVEPGDLHCHLVHRIPGFGVAVFSRGADLEQSLRVYAHRPPSQTRQATLATQQAAWQRNLRTPIGEVDVRDQYETLILGHRLANRLLQELDQGRRILLLDEDWFGAPGNVAVAISNVGFRASYRDYLSCETTLQEERGDWRQEHSATEHDGRSGLAPLLSQYGVHPPESPGELPEIVYFTHDGSELTAGERTRLRRFAGELLTDPRAPTLIITGHTDDTGPGEYNDRLGRERAEAVRDFLVNEIRFPSERITVETGGLSAPQAPNHDEEGRALNRRVELHPGTAD